MKITKLILLALLMITACDQADKDPAYLFSYFMGNGETGLYLAASEDGLNWEALNGGKALLSPEIGKDRLMRDPCIMQGPEGRFHMVWTTGWWDRHIGYAWSKDLIHWSDQKIIPVMAHEQEAKNCWAPELIYDKDTDLFHIFWATTIPGRHVDVADSEREKGLNHRMYATSTRDFETFEPTELFFDPDFSVIDASLLEKDGEYIMFLKNENPNPPEKNIRLSRSKNAAGPYSLEVSEPITGDYWAEGPSAISIGDYTYVYFDKYRERKYGAVRSHDLEKWEDVSDSISFPRGTKHGTVFSVSRDFYQQLTSDLNNHEAVLNTTYASLFMRSDSATYLEEVASETGDLYQAVGHHGPALENEWMGLRIYFDHKCVIDAYSKSKPGLELQEARWYPTVDQQMNGWGADYYKVGSTIGLGGVRLWDGENVVKLDPVSNRTAKIYNKEQSAVMEMISEGVSYMGRELDIMTRVSVKTGSRYARVEAFVLKGGPVQFVTGINYHKGQTIDKKDGQIAVWGLHPEDVAAELVELGAAILYNPGDFENVIDDGKQFLLISPKSEWMETKVIAASAREPEVNSMQALLDYTVEGVN